MNTHISKSMNGKNRKGKKNPVAQPPGPVEWRTGD
jgi:hypothetical protein